MRIFQYTFLIFLCFLLSKCATPPKYSDTPAIEFLSISKDTLQGGFSNEDFFDLRFSFTDGDGDFGLAAGDTSVDKNVFIEDSRTGELIDGFKTPEIPDLGASDDISGEVKIQIFTSCCIYPDYVCGTGLVPGQPPIDSFTYKITIQDRAGNISNEIETPPIFLVCN